MSDKSSFLENPLHNKEDIKRIQSAIIKDSDTLGKKSRFGYFSIPYPQTMGDRCYAFKGKPHERDEKGKVKTMPRNIQTTIPKWGKTLDVYFDPNFIKQDKFVLEKNKKIAVNEREELLKTIKSNKKLEVKTDKFKPSGPQTIKDIFKLKPYILNKPIFKEKERTTFYDKENKKFILPNRNIMTSPPKKGFNNTPGILFSYPKTEKLNKVRPKSVMLNKHEKDNNESKDVFRPANTQLNEFFVSNKNTFGLPKNLKEKLENDFKRAKSAGGQKYKKVYKDYWLKQERAFFPASGVKLGEKGYFSHRYGNPFTPFVALKRKKNSEEKHKDKFM